MAKELFVTAKGKAFYPHLDRPDTAFGANKFKTGIVLDAKGFAAFKDALDAYVSDNWKNKKIKPKLPFKKMDDGSYVITASSQYRPLIVDAKNNKLFDPFNEAHEGKELRIGGGSIVRLAVTFNAYDTGINLYLNQVQVVNLVEYSGGTAFEPDDDGYDASENDDTAFSDDEASEDLDI